MTKPQKILLSVGVCASILCAVGAKVLLFDNPAPDSVRTAGDSPAAAPDTRLHVNQPAQTPPNGLTAPAQPKLDGLGTSDKEWVSTFLAENPGPLDHYLSNLEGMTDVANARYGEPDRASWARALPIARVLEQGMCDCAQRNWLNQFIVLGEAGLSGDLAKYHAQGEVMATIGRFNGDSVDKQIVTTGGVR